VALATALVAATIIGSTTAASAAGVPPCDPGDPNPALDLPAVTRGTTWYLRQCFKAGTADIEFSYGLSTDVQVMGDWNGDGVITPGVFRDGTWYLRNTNTSGTAEVVFQFASTGDIPVVGDWDGDGKDSPGVFRRSNATFYFRDTNTSGAANHTATFGNPTDTPLVGDWNQDGKDTPGVFRAGFWYLTNQMVGGSAEGIFRYGNPTGDVPVVGDWNDDGTDTLGVFRNGMWFRTNVFGDPGLAGFQFGQTGDKPLVWSA